MILSWCFIAIIWHRQVKQGWALGPNTCCNQWESHTPLPWTDSLKEFSQTVQTGILNKCTPPLNKYTLAFHTKPPEHSHFYMSIYRGNSTSPIIVHIKICLFREVVYYSAGGTNSAIAENCHSINNQRVAITSVIVYCLSSALRLTCLQAS